MKFAIKIQTLDKNYENFRENHYKIADSNESTPTLELIEKNDKTLINNPVNLEDIMIENFSDWSFNHDIISLSIIEKKDEFATAKLTFSTKIIPNLLKINDFLAIGAVSNDERNDKSQITQIFIGHKISEELNEISGKFIITLISKPINFDKILENLKIARYKSGIEIKIHDGEKIIDNFDQTAEKALLKDKIFRKIFVKPLIYCDKSNLKCELIDHDRLFLTYDQKLENQAENNKILSIDPNITRIISQERTSRGVIDGFSVNLECEWLETRGEVVDVLTDGYVKLPIETLSGDDLIEKFNKIKHIDSYFAGNPSVIESKLWEISRENFKLHMENGITNVSKSTLTGKLLINIDRTIKRTENFSINLINSSPKQSILDTTIKQTTQPQETGSFRGRYNKNLSNLLLDQERLSQKLIPINIKIYPFNDFFIHDWKPYKKYQKGDIISYNFSEFTCKTDHISEKFWNNKYWTKKNNKNINLLGNSQEKLFFKTIYGERILHKILNNLAIQIKLSNIHQKSTLEIPIEYCINTKIFNKILFINSSKHIKDETFNNNENYFDQDNIIVETRLDVNSAEAHFYVKILSNPKHNYAATSNNTLDETFCLQEIMQNAQIEKSQNIKDYKALREFTITNEYNERQAKLVQNARSIVELEKILDKFYTNIKIKLNKPPTGDECQCNISAQDLIV